MNGGSWRVEASVNNSKFCGMLRRVRGEDEVFGRVAAGVVLASRTFVLFGAPVTPIIKADVAWKEWRLVARQDR